MRRLTACALLVLSTVAARAGAGDAPGSTVLVVGEAATLSIEPATLAASAVVDVPADVEALHVFVSMGSSTPLTIEEGPVNAAGAFIESIRESEFDGRGHLVRRDPRPGSHRIVVRSRGPMPADAVVCVEFDVAGEPPIVDLDRERLPGFVRRFRLYVPPHEGVAELRASGDADAVRVVVRDAEGVVGKPATLPLPLVGTESGGLIGVDVLRGSADALSRIRLVVPPAGGLATASALDARALEIGSPVELWLGGSGLPDRAAFELRVSDGCPGLRLTAKATRAGGSSPDLDVYVRRGRPVDSPMDDADFAGVGRGSSESLHLGGTEGLLPGTYRVLVELADADSPADVTVVAERLDGAGPPFPAVSHLPPDHWVAGALKAVVDPSLARWYEVFVPAGAASLHVQVVEATSDVDLVVVDARTGVIVGRALAFQIDEALVVRVPRAPPASYLIGVLSRDASEDEVEYRVAAAVDRPPALPADLRLAPFPRPVALGPTEAIATAVAEIQVGDGAGSAVCIGAEGYLLTCLHVVLDDETDQPTKGAILVAFPDDFRRAPRQSFRARLVAFDRALDLALLRVEADVYGRPTRPDLALPALKLGDSEGIRLGDPLVVFGYPGDGSERSRPPVTVSRGVVAGLEAEHGRLVWIKTDAWLATGHSGGAVVDASGRLVGLAEATLGEHDAVGLVRPTSLIPVEWLRKAGVAPAGDK